MSKPNNTRFVRFAESCFQYFFLLLLGFFLAWVLSAVLDLSGFEAMMLVLLPLLMRLGATIVCLFFVAVVYESLMAK